MNRIRKAFVHQFRDLLRQMRARKVKRGVQWLLDRSQALSRKENISPTAALTRVYRELASRRARRFAVSTEAPERFLCDAGLGGLARWLRAAGYEALWIPDIDDAALLRAARAHSATILTTDSMLLERRLVRDAITPAFWLPPALGSKEQLRLVFSQFGLKLREPRCMSCGGELLAVDKETLRHRIPPRTYGWLDQYYLCRKCDKLFWRGTHWQRIARGLQGLETIRH